MKEISNFIVEHWEMIGSGLLAIISVIVAAIKKRPVASDLGDSINSIFGLYGSVAIIEAEKTGRNGPEKLEYAVQFLINILRKKFVLCEEDEQYARLVFEYKIEGALETPRKKGK